MMQWLMIALGGALGAVGRYGLVGLVSSVMARNFPYGTLAVNILGSFFIGVLYVVVVERLHTASHWQPLLMVGFVGAFTTFSTFSLEALNLIQSGRILAAMTYILVSVVVCMLAVLLGTVLARLWI